VSSANFDVWNFFDYVMAIDPVTAIGLGANVLQFIDFAIKLVGTGKEIYNSIGGSTVENADIEAVTRTLFRLHEQILESNRARSDNSENAGRLSETEQNIESLGLECNNIAAELLGLLHELSAKGNRSKWASMAQALKSVWAKSKIESFHTRLHQYRAAMQTALLVSLR
jgi:hypothetical protein